jgi:hypothetical protein
MPEFATLTWVDWFNNRRLLHKQKESFGIISAARVQSAQDEQNESTRIMRRRESDLARRCAGLEPRALLCQANELISLSEKRADAPRPNA